MFTNKTKSNQQGNHTHKTTKKSAQTHQAADCQGATIPDHELLSDSDLDAITGGLCLGPVCLHF
ncbi:MAG: hypothetical protein F6K23_10720 [Okeania sp. SIO2C9]|uniref:hypothetical protein n=1 Tax=Okeania sp. SIO2C9 TaxID=2607791 RepID=UPI0013BED2B9|nr:hypothetical protein [Okeania sp. SIO2C9]NEQ73499.1 hypothetical protein [Okeania sp. SIO2C9]